MAKNPTMAEKCPDMFLPDTNQDPRQRKRVRPMQVLKDFHAPVQLNVKKASYFTNGDFNRTYVAIQQALDILGIPCWHGLFSDIRDAERWSAALDAKYFGKGSPFQRSDWDQLLGNFSGASDVPAVCFVAELIHAYPEAKVILVSRDMEEWYKSFHNAVVAATWNPIVMVISKCDKWYLGPLKDMTHRWINEKVGIAIKKSLRNVLGRGVLVVAVLGLGMGVAWLVLRMG